MCTSSPSLNLQKRKVTELNLTVNSINMSLSMTTASHGLSPTYNPELVTKIGAKGIVSAVLLVLICIIAVMLWCLSRHKGSYVTNETEDDDDDGNNDDDESVRSDAALQAKEPLKLKEEE
ncbi:Glycophorin-C [Channa argus]|uniref:Glycophorin-C n=1 Tax=Channa argus TaxID=215402 RepID=A0A6G1PDR4_CHAAH|nr:Glycophorin-C [Channa argus]